MMRPLVRGVRRELGRRQREDQPAAPGIDRFKLQDIAKERPHPGSIVSEDDRVDTSDHV